MKNNKKLLIFLMISISLVLFYIYTKNEKTEQFEVKKDVEIGELKTSKKSEIRNIDKTKVDFLSYEELQKKQEADLSDALKKRKLKNEKDSNYQDLMDLKNSNINYQMYSELDVSDDVGFELEKLTYPYEREVVNYVLIEMNVSDFKKKIKNNSIKNISIMDEKYENHYFEYYNKITNKQNKNFFTIRFNNDKGMLILQGNYNDDNISGKFTSEGLLSNILIKNNKGYVYNANN